MSTPTPLPDAIEDLSARATPGPWRALSYMNGRDVMQSYRFLSDGSSNLGDELSHEDATFIVRVVNDVRSGALVSRDALAQGEWGAVRKALNLLLPYTWAFDEGRVHERVYRDIARATSWLESALSASPAAEPEPVTGWRGISSAPLTDDEVVLGWHEADGEWVQALGFYEGSPADRDWVDSVDGGRLSPTHWQPLAPTPPATQGGR